MDNRARQSVLMPIEDLVIAHTEAERAPRGIDHVRPPTLDQFQCRRAKNPIRPYSLIISPIPPSFTPSGGARPCCESGCSPASAGVHYWALPGASDPADQAFSRTRHPLLALSRPCRTHAGRRLGLPARTTQNSAAGSIARRKSHLRRPVGRISTRKAARGNGTTRITTMAAKGESLPVRVLRRPDARVPVFAEHDP